MAMALAGSNSNLWARTGTGAAAIVGAARAAAIAAPSNPLIYGQKRVLVVLLVLLA
jgi:hypothetical protein